MYLRTSRCVTQKPKPRGTWFQARWHQDRPAAGAGGCYSGPGRQRRSLRWSMSKRMRSKSRGRTQTEWQPRTKDFREEYLVIFIFGGRGLWRVTNSFRKGKFAICKPDQEETAKWVIRYNLCVYNRKVNKKFEKIFLALNGHAIWAITYKGGLNK